MSVSTPQGDATESEETVPCLLCDACEMPICTLSDVITDRAGVLDKAVYSYELDLLGEDIWVYSATNPSARRFDVVRCSSSIVSNKLVRCSSQFDSQHSWFPPYEWCMCECGACGRHLGWGFRLGNTEQESEGAAVVTTVGGGDGGEQENATESMANTNASSAPLVVVAQGGDDTVTTDGELASSAAQTTRKENKKASIAFVGIIVTHCRPVEHYSLTKYNTLLDGAHARAGEQRKFSRMMSELFYVLSRVPNRLAANYLGMRLLDLQYDRRMEVLSEILNAARDLLLESQTQPSAPAQRSREEETEDEPHRRRNRDGTTNDDSDEEHGEESEDYENIYDGVGTDEAASSHDESDEEDEGSSVEDGEEEEQQPLRYVDEDGVVSSEGEAAEAEQPQPTTAYTQLSERPSGDPLNNNAAALSGESNEEGETGGLMDD